MEKMDGKTIDIVADNISKLKALFPEAVTEGKIDFDILKELLGEYVDDRDERYSFTWNGKTRARMLAQTPSTGTLRPCPEESVDWETTQNIFIEGDNLEVLKLLQKSYHKKVKMIYIDPPYNTGHDFVYKDDFKDNIKNYKLITGQIDGEGRNISSNPETSGRYHTDWLNMMYSRLKLARNLLKDEGLAVISIDENEASNLEKIISETFGEENYLGTIPVIMNLKGNQDAFCFAETHEFIGVTCRDKSSFVPGMLPVEDEELIDDWLEDEYGLFKEADNLRATGVNAPREKRPNLYYPIFLNSETHEFYVTENDEPKSKDDIEILPINPQGDELSWYWGKTTFNNSKHNLILKETSNGWQFYRKQRPKLGDLPTKKPKSVLYKSDYSTSTATTHLKKIFDAKIFDGPKPVPFIIDLFHIGAEPSDIVLDFFAGSGATAHAVMQLNAEDNGNRKYIMVQLPEPCDEKSEAYKSGFKNIADIGKERIRRAAAKIKKEYPEFKGDLGFKVFKLDSTNIKPWEADFDTLNETLLEDYITNIKPGRTESDILYEILLKYGLDLTLTIKEHTIAGQKVFDIGMGALIICLSDAVDLDVVEGIAGLKQELEPEIMRVVFKDSGFADDVVKTNAVQILKQAGIEDVRSL
jgi:adenine-specific DNA-methyltransferase